MKKSGLLLILPLMLIFLTSFVAAGFIEDAFKFLGFPTDSTELIIVTVVVFVIFALAFGDILSKFTLFSPWVSWMIGFGIAIIGGLTGLIKLAAVALMQIGAGLGVFSVAIAIGTAFAAFAILHLGLGFANPLFRWVAKRQLQMEAAKGSDLVQEGMKVFAEGGDTARKIGRKKK